MLFELVGNRSKNINTFVLSLFDGRVDKDEGQKHLGDNVRYAVGSFTGGKRDEAGLLQVPDNRDYLNALKR